MSYSQDSERRNSRSGLYCLIIISFVIIGGIGSILFGWIFLLLIPLGFLLVLLFYLTSRYFWSPKKHCARCNAPVTVYSEYCKNCGLKLINKCPKCGSYSKTGVPDCIRCGYKFEVLLELEEDQDIAPYQILSRGTPPPDKPNFCPNCGTGLGPEQQNRRFCEACGGRLDR